MLAATDPPDRYGTMVKWPQGPFTLMRTVGSSVILVNGALAAYLSRGEKQVFTFLPEDEPSRSMVAREVASALASIVESGTRRALLITEVNDETVAKSALAPFLVEAGFAPSALGYQMRHREAGSA